MVFARDQASIQHRASNAVRETLSGIAYRDIDIGAPGVAANEAGVIDGVKHLPRPAMRFFAKAGDQAARPCFKLSEPILRVVSFSAFVVLTTDENVIGI